MDDTILIPEGCLKLRTKKYVVYDVEWLLEHLEMEFDILSKYRRYKTEILPLDEEKIKEIINENHKR